MVKVTMIDDYVCPGKGKCHGCVKWCDSCGDVGHVCDVRLDGERCNAHPIPPTQAELSQRRKAAENRLLDAQRADREARTELVEIHELQQSRNAYVEQMVEQERRLFGIR